MILLCGCGMGDDEPMSHTRLERMLADGDTPWIGQVFRRHPDSVLSFIDHYLEGGLKIIEDGGDADRAAESFRTGLKFAKVADEALQEMIFSEYAAAFGSWSRAEQKRFREGQAAYHAGRKASDDPAAALAHFQRSLALAEPLGDLWGTAMAYGGIARSRMALGEYEEAKTAAMKAAELNGRLRLRLAHIRARLVCGTAHAKLGKPAAGRGHLRIAWDQCRESDDKELRAKVLDGYCNALEAAGKGKLAAELRKAEAKEAAKVGDPGDGQSQ